MNPHPPRLRAPWPLHCSMQSFWGGEDEFQVHWPSWSRSGPFLRTHTKPAPNKKRAGPNLRLGLAPLIFLRPLSADQSETLRQAQRRASGQPGSRENRRFALGAASKRRLGVWAGQRRSARSLGFEKGFPLYSLSKAERPIFTASLAKMGGGHFWCSQESSDIGPNPIWMEEPHPAFGKRSQRHVTHETRKLPEFNHSPFHDGA